MLIAETNLKELRKKNRVTQRMLSDLLGLKTPSAYYKKEAGHIPFTIQEAGLIADYFQKDVNEIFLNLKVPKKTAK